MTSARFSPQARILGCGDEIQSIYQSARLASSTLVGLDGVCTPLASPAQVADVLAANGLNPAVTIGMGNVCPHNLVLAPGLDTAANVLGRGSRYHPLHDVGDKLSISSIIKYWPEDAYFGAPIDGLLDSDRNASHFVKWAKKIYGRVSAELTRYTHESFGGNFMDCLLDWRYDPVIVAGSSYFPTVHDTWTAFRADAETVARFENIKSVWRQHCASICLELSVGHFRDLAESADQEDGQDMIRIWFSNFRGDELVTVSSRATALRGEEHYIVDFEDPSVKLIKVLNEYQAIRATESGGQYLLSWFNETVRLMIDDNMNYAIWRGAGGTLKLLQSRLAGDTVSLVNNVYSAHHVEWEKAAGVMAVRAATVAAAARGAAVRAASAAGLRAAGQRRPATSSVLATLTCWRCGEVGHIATSCTAPVDIRNRLPYKGKGKGVAGGKPKVPAVKPVIAKKPHQGRRGRQVARTAGWDAPPCKYQGCKQNDKSSHAAADCPDKLAMDRHSRACDPQTGAAAAAGAIVPYKPAAPKAARSALRDGGAARAGSSRRVAFHLARNTANTFDPQSDLDGDDEDDDE